MPKSRSIDIDDKYDFEIVKFFLKGLKMKYLNTFKLHKVAFFWVALEQLVMRFVSII